MSFKLNFEIVFFFLSAILQSKFANIQKGVRDVEQISVIHTYIDSDGECVFVLCTRLCREE